MPPLSPVAWCVWAAISFGFFLSLELTAIDAESGRSQLPVRLRRWLGIEPRSIFRRLVVPAVVSLVAGFGATLVPLVTIPALFVHP